MTCKSIYDAALRLLNETDKNALDYEDRAGYILATFCTECSGLDNRYRVQNGEGPKSPFAKLYLELDSTFPLSNVLLPAAQFYLAAMLVIDENEELSDRYFAKYTDAVSSILESSSKASPMKDRYGLL
jgi:hypothetical protein